MVRPISMSLVGGLALASLVFGACGGGAIASAPAGGTTQTTTTPAAASAAAPSATPAPAPTAAANLAGNHNGRIAYGVRAADGTANIFSVLPDGTNQRQLTTGAGNHLCAAYSADGNLLAYCADVSGAFEIWTMQPDGTKPTQVTHLGGRALFPDFSRDGTKIAFGGVEGDDPDTQIYVVDATTGEGLVALTRCPELKGGCSNDYPAWSPDGRSIVFIHTDDYDANENPINEQVWVMNADGSDARALTTDSPAKDQVPDWSPDGSQIAFASGSVDNEGIWVMNADGTEQRQLSGCLPGQPSPCAAGSDFGPVWSPDATSIAFLRSFLGLGIQDRPIFVMNADGTDQHRLAEGTLLQAVPAWQFRADGEGD
jgi:TolB protein